MAHYFTTTLAVVAGICLAFGLLFFFIAVRNASRRTVALLFAAFSLSYGAAVLTARNHYLAQSADQARSWDRVTVIMASVAFIFLLWFVASYTNTAHGRARWLLVPLTVIFVAAVAIGMFAPELLRGEAGTVDTVVLPWGEQVRVASGDDGLVDTVFVLAQLVVIGLIVAMTARQFRRGDRERERAVYLSVGLAWFITTLVVSLLVDAGVLDFVYLSDIGFVGFVVAISLEEAKSTLDTEEELVAYQGHLQDMVDEQTAELEEAHAEVVARAATDAALAERSRLARDLHDAVTQLLFSINLIAQSLPRLWETDPAQATRSSHELTRLTRGALAEMRTLLRELRPNTLLEADLPTLISQLTEGVAARYDVEAAVQIDMGEADPPEVRLVFYRVAQEAINNIAKHAEATRLSVNLTSGPDQLRLQVVDDGCGFDPEHVRSEAMGLDIMRERADAIGAEFTVDSDDDGTTIRLDWPALASAALS